MIEILPAEVRHLEQMAVADHHKHESVDINPNNCMTIAVNGKPVAIIGWYFVMEGVMHVWSFTSKEVNQCSFAFHRTINSLIKYAFTKYALRRMQMSVLCGFSMGRRWAQSLGFESEGIMKKYGPGGRDYWLFGRAE